VDYGWKWRPHSTSVQNLHTSVFMCQFKRRREASLGEDSRRESCSDSPLAP